MSKYIGNLRGCFIRNLYMLELGGSDFSESDLTSMLTDNKPLTKKLPHRGVPDLKIIFDEYSLKIRDELLGDGYIVEAQTSWTARIPKIYHGIRLTATGKAIAAELEKAKDGIKSKIGK